MTIDELNHIYAILQIIRHYDCIYENMLVDDVIEAMKIIEKEIQSKENE